MDIVKEYFRSVFAHRSRPLKRKFLGIITSLVSVTYRTADWYLPRKKNSSLIFFLPHTLFRITSLAFICSFLRYYSLIPYSLFLLSNLVIFVFIVKDMPKGKYELFASFPFTLLASIAATPGRKESRLWMKRTILLSTIFNLLCLILIYLLPILASPMAIKSTTGLSHIHFEADTVSDNISIFNASLISINASINASNNASINASINASLNSSGNINGSQVTEDYLTHEQFATVWFPLLLLLGTICLVDGRTYSSIRYSVKMFES